MTDAAIPVGWEGIFTEGERILWQGRPNGDFYFPVTDVPKLVPHVIGMGVGMALVVPVALRGGPLFLLPVILMIVSMVALLKAIWSDTRRRRACHYTLSNRAGYIAVDGRKRALETYPITPSTEVQFAPLRADIAGDLGSVFFGIRSEKIGKDNRKMLVGFERIMDAKTVFALIQDVKEGRA